MDTARRLTALLLVTTVGVQAGPYVSRSRPVAGPLVDAAQSALHHHFLRVEAEVLKDSVEVGRLADSTTARVYDLTREATADLAALSVGLEADVRRLREGAARGCVDPAYRQVIRYIDNMSEKLYNCTHGVSNTGAWYEVKMTYRLIAARDQVWYIKQAMAFCQKFQQHADTQCLARLTAEGELMLRELPERGRAVLSQARAAEQQVSRRLERCMTKHKTAAEERHLAETERMRTCELRVPQ